MRPRNVLGNVAVGLVTRIYLTFLHAAVSLAGLCVPLAVFFRFKPWLHQFAKRPKSPK